MSIPYQTKFKGSFLLIPSISVSCSSGLDDVRRRRFSNTQVHEWRHDSGIQHVPSIDEGPRRRIRKLFEAQSRLLGSDEGAGGVNVPVSIEVCQG